MLVIGQASNTGHHCLLQTCQSLWASHRDIGNGQKDGGNHY